MKVCGTLDPGSIPGGCTTSQYHSIMFRLLRFLPIVYVTTLLGEFSQIWWLFELISHWRIFYVCVGIFLLLLFAMVQKMRSFSLVLMIMSVHLLRITPYIVLNAEISPKTSHELSVLFANTYWLAKSEAALVTSIRELDPDIILFFEILNPTFTQVKQKLKDYPYGEYTAAMYAFNIGYLSKVPVKKTVHYFVPFVPTLELETQLNGQPVSILGAHPYSPVDGEFVERRNTLLDELFAYASVQKKPVLLGGDLNITPFSPYYWQLKSGYPQLSDSLEKFGLQNSWPTHTLPNFFAIPIDHAWTNSKLKVFERKLGSQTGSDHFPLFVRVGI